MSLLDPVLIPDAPVLAPTVDVVWRQQTTLQPRHMTMSTVMDARFWFLASWVVWFNLDF